MRRAFSLLEILIVMVMIALATALVVSNLNLGRNTSEAAAANLMTSFGAIESALLNYNNDKGAWPATGGGNNALSDSAFVPGYLFVPNVPKNFDKTYGVNGFRLGLQTGQASPNNGYYVCAKVHIDAVTDPLMIALTNLNSTMSANKYFFKAGSDCPSVGPSDAPAAGADFYVTYWITRS